MIDERPNPDQLLARVQSAESQARRGKLKIFFGYVAGVGKTFAMLEAARREKADGVEVVVGYVEPHGRAETEALLEGLEILPVRSIPYRGVTLREFDLDAALKRRPKLILVDELAHTNAEGSRHAKRWQDVEELLEAGIDVYSTLNVQHIESLNDVIAQITGVIVRETLPDSVLERADEFELIDLTPEELMERLPEGKVYVPQQAERALESFFQKSNLVALRELSLRQTAQRLRRDVDSARREKAVLAPWATNERLLVCVGPSPTTAKLIRTAKRMAAAFGADWIAVAVETQRQTASGAAREQVARHLQLAEQLGAETHTLVGGNVAATVLDYARSRNVTKIEVGKTALPWWKRLWRGSVVDQILEQSGDIDVYVIKGDVEAQTRLQTPPARTNIAPWRDYAATVAVVALCGLFGGRLHSWGLTETNIVMVFLLGVAFSASRYGRGPAVLCSILSVVVFDFFFVPPRLSFSVSDTQYLLTFGVMLGIGLLISELTARVKAQLLASQQQERRTAALYRLTKQLSEVAGADFLISNAGQQLREIFDGDVLIFLRDDSGTPALRFGGNSSIAQQPINAVVAHWVADHDQMAGLGTATLPNATALFVPLTGSQRTIGALGVRPKDHQQILDPDQRRLLETCASLIALSLERDQSVQESHQAQLQVQTEQLRNSLLSSVSHDLRTPLAAIAGAGSSLLQNSLSDESTGELVHSIVDETRRMTRLVDNLLDMTRLQSGNIALNKQWHVLEEIIGSARARLRKELAEHEVIVSLPHDFPLLLVDGLLFEQVFVNLLENAARYTPKGSVIEMTAETITSFSSQGVGQTTQACIRVADNGPGLPPGTESRVFEEFYSGASDRTPDQRRGVGLGLAICRSILEAHGGEIEARNRSDGAEFLLKLPCREPAPQVALDEAAATRT
ncbi:MAG: sensor histidine kinase KdpD [Gemmataceae bacterium]|nr:sensor histidine kinase KdpD [Gemmataceae bacterium]